MRRTTRVALCVLGAGLASCDAAPQTYDIGEGRVLEYTPPQYATIVDNTSCEQWLAAVERGDPKTFKPMTDAVVIQEESVEVSVTPATYNRDGTVKAAAKMRVRKIPKVTRQESYPAIDPRPGNAIDRGRARCKPVTRRVVSTPPTFTVKDQTGAVVDTFETAEAAANAINSR